MSEMMVQSGIPPTACEETIMKMKTSQWLAAVLAVMMLCGVMLSGCNPTTGEDETSTMEEGTTEAVVESNTDTDTEAVTTTADTDEEQTTAPETTEFDTESATESQTKDYWELTYIERVEPVDKTVHAVITDDGADCYQSPNDRFFYGYGANYLYNEDGSVDLWYASCGDGASYWDCVSYRHSEDGGKTWSMPQAVVYPTPGSEDGFSCCDPGVVYFNGYYYIGYTSTMNGNGLCNNVYVARSERPNGPYEKWNGSGWGGLDPRPIFHYDFGDSTFGAGEPSFVELNGTLYIYYRMAKPDYEGKAYDHPYYMVATADATDENWPATIQNHGAAFTIWSLSQHTDSLDVKYVEEWGKFVGITTGRRMTDKGYIAVYESDDGLTFELVDVIRDKVYAGCHNAGFSSRPNGRIRLSEDADRLHITYGYGINTGAWNIKAQPVALSLTDGNDMEAEKAKPCYSYEMYRADDKMTEALWSTPVRIITDRDEYVLAVNSEGVKPVVSTMTHLGSKRNVTNYYTFSFEVADESVAIVDENGVVIPRGVGYTQVKVTVTDEGTRPSGVLGFGAYFYVCVEEDPDEPVYDKIAVSMTPVRSEYVIAINEKDFCRPVIRGRVDFANGDVTEVYVTSDPLGITFTGYDDTVISVSEFGEVTALAVGETDVTVTYGEFSFTVHVRVSDDPADGFFLHDRSLVSIG